MIPLDRDASAASDVAQTLLDLDPDGHRFARVFRDTFDQLYDGQRTGRYSWEQLFKTEKTHFGTLIEINLQREFRFSDGKILDFEIAGHEVDCKYSGKDGGWMLPPESWGRLALVATANDALACWSVGVVHVDTSILNESRNRDGKATIRRAGREAIHWVFREADMPPNVLLQLSPNAVSAVFEKRRGQARLDELFRQAEGRRIHRSTIATVAQQDDFMKRVRYNGGSRSTLQREGFLIPGGDYESHRRVAADFGVVVPRPGEVVSFRVTPSTREHPLAVEMEGLWWRRAMPTETVTTPSPILPTTGR